MSIVACLALASSATAATVNLTASCGQVLTERNTYVLQNDVGPCSSEGIIIRNPGSGAPLVLDLNGHTIRGHELIPDGPDEDRLPDGGFDEGGGILVEGSKNIVVTSSQPGGTVRDFDVGVLLAPTLLGKDKFRPTTDSTVEKLNVTKNAGSVPDFFFPETGGFDDEVTEFAEGIAVVSSSNNTIKNNNVFENQIGGIRLDDAVNNTFSENTVEANGGSGFRVITGNTGNLITKNTVRNNRGTGVNFSFTNPGGNTVRANTLQGNFGFGVATGYESDGTVIDNNLILTNRNGGITLGSAENTLTDNTVTNNGRGATGTGRGNGIFVGSGTDNFPRVGTTVSGNTVTGSGGNGIRINCMSDQDPENFAIYGCTPWDLHNEVVNNVATGNAINGPNGTRQKTGTQDVGWFDLLDSSNSNATVTPFDPASAPSVDDPDVPYSGGPITDCDNNTWSNNTYGTAYPACAGG